MLVGNRLAISARPAHCSGTGNGHVKPIALSQGADGPPGSSLDSRPGGRGRVVWGAVRSPTDEAEAKGRLG